MCAASRTRDRGDKAIRSAEPDPSHKLPRLPSSWSWSNLETARSLEFLDLRLNTTAKR